ncbi:hypothetical protein R3P38DRAFT_2496653 [Favolaschia claudopus]|uniref:Uncharacterized protein n=1 Tax=Favolaschia claudopus TaxID=2862362 RepID=A0AAW0DWH7_9AGAR
MLGPRPIHSHSAQPSPSTKGLINRFESLSSQSTSMSASDTTTLKTKSPLYSGITSSKKDKSPIRQSLRNLLAALKKGSGLRAGKPTPETPARLAPTPESLQEPLPAMTLSPTDTCSTSTKSFYSQQLTGSLYYLVRFPETLSTSQNLPTWTFCSAVLEDNALHLTCKTTASIYAVSLQHCLDVRQEAEEESESGSILLGEDMKVFEVLERARWVSAVWDIILPTNEASVSAKETKPIHSPESVTPPRPSSTCVDRALPPLPERPLSPIAVRIWNASFNSASPLVNSSATCTVPAKRPSITDLGRLSVVTQRRARLEGHGNSASTSPSQLQRTSTLIRRNSQRVPGPLKDEATGRASPTSILDSYSSPHKPTARNIQSDPGNPVSSCFLGDHPSDEPHNVPSTQSLLLESLAEDIRKTMSEIRRQTDDTNRTLHNIHSAIGQRLEPDPSSPAILNVLRGIDERLRSDLPYILKHLAQIQVGGCGSEYHNSSQTKEAAAFDALDKVPLVLSPILIGRHISQINQILLLLEESVSQRTVQAKQQADSWLEAFVRGGTAQISVVAAGVEQISQRLGCSSDSVPSLVAEIRQLAPDGQPRDQIATLLASINNLTASMNSESPGSTSQSIVDLINRQRQEQEKLLRALVAGLSDEIRGERSRFVDAMKEATAINVQLHVEELKKELAREVRADPLAYHSKQPQPIVTPSQKQPSYLSNTSMGPPQGALPDPRYTVYS